MKPGTIIASNFRRSLPTIRQKLLRDVLEFLTRQSLNCQRTIRACIRFCRLIAILFGLLLVASTHVMAQPTSETTQPFDTIHLSYDPAIAVQSFPAIDYQLASNPHALNYSIPSYIADSNARDDTNRTLTFRRPPFDKNNRETKQSANTQLKGTSGQDGLGQIDSADRAKSSDTATSFFETSSQDNSSQSISMQSEIVSFGQDQWTNREQVKSTSNFLLSIGVFSLAPALILMSTCFVRIVIVLSILRQALGAQQMPPTQVIMALSMFMTFLIMAPVWNEVKSEAIDPYTATDSQMDWDVAWERGTKPLKKFMSRQIDNANNGDDVWLFFEYLPEEEKQNVPTRYEEVPLKVLLPAFLISELKIAFIIGVQIYLPFLILDIVISSVTVSMGMMMLPPTMISLPFKLLLFVLVDGWSLIVGMLLESFAPYT